MNFKKVLLTAFIGSVFLASCSDDDNVATTQVPLGAYDNGVLVLNQGGFNHGDAEVAYLSDDFSTFQNNIFSTVNLSAELGDTGQDIGFNNDLAYIVLNVSNKIEIVNRYTFKSVGTIDAGLNNPRYIVFANGKAYVSNWGNPSNTADDYVAVINLDSNTVSQNIPVAEGPERILVNDDKLYVAQTGGYGYGNSITVIDTASNTVTATIATGDVPGTMAVDNGALYVVCSGKPSYSGAETGGQLDKINLSSNVVSSHIDFAATSHPSNLQIADNALYYTVDSGIFKTTTTATTLPAAPLFTTTDQGVYGVYAFAVHGENLFVADAGDYNSAGKIYVYSLTGDLKHDYTVGVIPAGFYFN